MLTTLSLRIVNVKAEFMLSRAHQSRTTFADFRTTTRCLKRCGNNFVSTDRFAIKSFKERYLGHLFL